MNASRPYSNNTFRTTVMSPHDRASPQNDDLRGGNGDTTTLDGIGSHSDRR